MPRLITRRQILSRCFALPVLGIGAASRCINAESYALLTVSSLAAESPYRLGVVDPDREFREVARDICGRRSAVDKDIRSRNKAKLIICLQSRFETFCASRSRERLTRIREV
jgi:hypothetical protein